MIVLGVIGDDVHVVANRLLQDALHAAGFQTHNLGARVTADEFVRAAVGTGAHAVLVSSINGEAEYWCAGFRKRFADAGRGEILLYVGGNLVVGDRDEREVVSTFRGFGFDRVFYRPRDLSDAIRCLREDLSGGDA